MSNSKGSVKKKATPARSNSRSPMEMHVGSGNVFKDMGRSDEEAANLLIRSRLMIVIEETIRSRGWTQSHAAKHLGIAQPRIAELFAGRLSLFTIDTLVKYLTRLGKEVTLKVKDADVA